MSGVTFGCVHGSVPTVKVLDHSISSTWALIVRVSSASDLMAKSIADFALANHIPALVNSLDLNLLDFGSNHTQIHRRGRDFAGRHE